MSNTDRSAHTTTDHDFIRRWVEERGGTPSHVKRTGDKEDPGILRIDFPGYSGKDSLEEISWEEFFEKFEENGLALLHRDMKGDDGELDRFNKLISRKGTEEAHEGGE
ncbi:hypothetical protein [Longimicrobium terrae]|uniref:1,4-alpha-glucan branching enzyme n=1 Tax=Longimicrobium terrae TaxID=1639882 RepID=A0A841H1V7_9BACT|nr:hypothetical protein [Longimicrobium terrae]MBB4637718.1 hypothetical protein [Longimicrobium terrae]MBB6072115.1 hypothetical protein [Longimicrobium terrae]NNC29803.1 hypothetical protein [Longimicrobium terrae]